MRGGEGGKGGGGASTAGIPARGGGGAGGRGGRRTERAAARPKLHRAEAIFFFFFFFFFLSPPPPPRPQFLIRLGGPPLDPGAAGRELPAGAPASEADQWGGQGAAGRGRTGIDENVAGGPNGRRWGLERPPERDGRGPRPARRSRGAAAGRRIEWRPGTRPSAGPRNRTRTLNIPPPPSRGARGNGLPDFCFWMMQIPRTVFPNTTNGLPDFTSPPEKQRSTASGAFLRACARARHCACSEDTRGSD